MREYITSALVLGSKSSGINDRMVDLYTKDFGRLKAKIVGGRKITSKLSPYLQEADLVQIRLVEKNKFTVTDALIKERFGKTRSVFELLFLLKSLLPQLVPDPQFWFNLVRSVKEGKISNGIFLKFLGYNPMLARCEGCSSKVVSQFLTTDQIFLCRRCADRFPSMSSNLLPLS